MLPQRILLIGTKKSKDFFIDIVGALYRMALGSHPIYKLRNEEHPRRASHRNLRRSARIITYNQRITSSCCVLNNLAQWRAAANRQAYDLCMSSSREIAP